jgi:hypothetical protein
LPSAWSVSVSRISLGVGGPFSAAGAAASAAPEIVGPAPAPYLSTPVDRKANGLTPTGDPLVVISGASLAAGGAILGLRHLASRRRAMR